MRSVQVASTHQSRLHRTILLHQGTQHVIGSLDHGPALRTVGVQPSVQPVGEESEAQAVVQVPVGELTARAWEAEHPAALQDKAKEGVDTSGKFRTLYIEKFETKDLGVW